MPRNPADPVPHTLLLAALAIVSPGCGSDTFLNGHSKGNGSNDVGVPGDDGSVHAGDSGDTDDSGTGTWTGTDDTGEDDDTGGPDGPCDERLRGARTIKWCGVIPRGGLRTTWRQNAPALGDITGSGSGELVLAAANIGYETDQQDQDTVYLLRSPTRGGRVEGDDVIHVRHAPVSDPTTRTFFGSYGLMAQDLTGDGIADLAIPSGEGPPGSDNQYRVWVFLAPITEDMDTSAADAVLTANGTSWGVTSVPDLDGDGVAELLVAGAAYWAPGESYLVLDPTQTQDLPNTADAVYRSTGGRHSTTTTSDDVTGDGVSEIILIDAGSGLVHVVPGTERGVVDPADYPTLFDDWEQWGSSGEVNLQYDGADLGDYDDDGYLDILLRVDDQGLDQARIISGPVTESLSIRESLAELGTGDGRSTGHRTGLATFVGDVDGDGAGPDVALRTCEGETCTEDAPLPSELSKIAVFGHGLTGEHPLAEAQTLIHQAAGTTESFTAAPLPVGDVDQDGIDDILISAPGDSEEGDEVGAAWIILGGSW